MIQTLSYKQLSCLTLKKWSTYFQCGDFETQLSAQFENPSMVWTSEIADHVHDLILAKQQILAKKITKTSDSLET